MANGNGWVRNMLMTVLILALTAVGALVVSGSESTRDSIGLVQQGVQNNAEKIDGVEDKQTTYDRQQARVALQLALMAQSDGLPVVVDTIAAESVLRDST